MNLEQVIDRYTNNAEYERTHGSLHGYLEFRQLAEWLKDYKRLLEQQPCEDTVSRQAALNSLIDNTHLDGYDLAEALDAIENKEKLPPVTQIPIECEDAISRDELLRAIDTWDKFGYTETGCFVREPKCDYVPYIHYDDVIKCIKGMPSVTQKSGRWIDGKCNKCGTHAPFWSMATTYYCSEYCPKCGAKMVEPQESEE